MLHPGSGSIRPYFALDLSAVLLFCFALFCWPSHSSHGLCRQGFISPVYAFLVSFRSVFFSSVLLSALLFTRSISPWSFSPLPVDSILNAWIMGHNLYLLGSGTAVSLSILGLGREGKSRRARKTPLYYPNIIQPAGRCTTGLIE
jgi:hypothetical protein